MSRAVSPAGHAFTKSIETFSEHRYPDAGRWSIGYGTEWLPGMSDPMSEQEATEHFLDAMHWVDAAINDLIEPDVILTQNQVDAIGDFIYNEGRSQFEQSHLRQVLNEGITDERVHEQLKRWRFSRGVELPSLVRRRQKEWELFNTPVKAVVT